MFTCAELQLQRTYTLPYDPHIKIVFADVQREVRDRRTLTSRDSLIITIFSLIQTGNAQVRIVNAPDLEH